MWSWHDRQYLGAAHGAGNVWCRYSLLCTQSNWSHV
jgi:hypothetical protein